MRYTAPRTRRGPAAAGVFLFLLAPGLWPGPEEALQSVVRIRATVPPDAFTASSLGTEREGSGVAIDSAGHIVTIGYLVLEAESIQVLGPQGRSSSASYVGYDSDSGLGLIRADGPVGTAPIPLGRSSELEQGARIAVASHGNSPQPVRLVSRMEFTGDWEYLLEDALYTAPPHVDFGGAALLGAGGELLGIGSIFTSLFVPGFGAVPCNMFVPIDLLKPILADLVARGRPQRAGRPWLGLGAGESSGRVIVTRITDYGPAARAGLQRGDVILAVDGKAVAGLSDLYRKVWALGDAGVSIRLTVLQGTQIREISVSSADRYQFLKLSRGGSGRLVMGRR